MKPPSGLTSTGCVSVGNALLSNETSSGRLRTAVNDCVKDLSTCLYVTVKVKTKIENLARIRGIEIRSDRNGSWWKGHAVGCHAEVTIVL